MSFSPYNPNDRYRQRAAQRTTNFLVGVFVFGLVFAGGFWLGGMRAKQNTYILEEENRSLATERDTIQEEMTVLRAETQTASVRLEQIKTDYDELLSEGPMKNLLVLIRKQLEGGVAAERLESVILSARPPQNCSEPDHKRFVVDTPVYKGPKSQSSIAGGVVKISGEGVSAQNAQGQKEAWFDVSQPVKLTFKNSMEAKTKEGMLPLYYSMVVEDKEYRFTVSEGEKSFAKVTYDFCDYP